MARNSRIPHPPGGRFFQVHAWAVEAVGFAAAAVLGELDFKDRVREQPGQPVASRAELVAALAGIVGRNSVDKALEQLLDNGWVIKHDHHEIGARNFKTWHEYALNIEKIGEYLQEGKPASRFWDAGFPGIRPASGKPVYTRRKHKYYYSKYRRW